MTDDEAIARAYAEGLEDLFKHAFMSVTEQNASQETIFQRIERGIADLQLTKRLMKLAILKEATNATQGK